MRIKDWKKKLKLWWQWWPFNRNALILLLLAIWLSPMLHPESNRENINDKLLPFVRLMGNFVAIFLASIITLSLLSTLIAWLYYLWIKKKKGLGLVIQFEQEEKGEQKSSWLSLSLPKAIRPLLGFVQARILYDDNEMTESFGLLSRGKINGKDSNQGIYNKSRIELPYVKEYTIKGAMLFFEDIFRLISIPTFEAHTGHFFQAPKLESVHSKSLQPKQSNEMDVRIDELRKVEGDYLHYKNFESGDDVRRIVWKLYAKNRNLVVRMPERLEPYASKVNFYVSFYQDLGSETWEDKFLAALLNGYKNKIWSLYCALLKQNWDLQYLADQEFSLPESLNEQERIERIISNSTWQSTDQLADMNTSKRASVLVISSLCSVDVVKKLMAEANPDVQIYLLKISDSLRFNQALHWINRLIFIQGNDQQSKLKNRWIWSPLRRRLQKNEQQIEQLFENTK